MKTIKIIHFLFILLAMGMSVSSCKDDDDTLFVSIDKTDIELYRKETCQLHVKVQDMDNEYQEKVQWSVYDFSLSEEATGSAVISVDENGLVTALDYGTATIKAEIANGRYALTNISVNPRNIGDISGISFESPDFYIAPSSITDSLVINMDSTILEKYDLEIISSDPALLEVENIFVPVNDKKQIYKTRIIAKGTETPEDNPVKVTLKVAEKEIECNVHINAQIYLSFETIITGLGGEPGVIDQKPYKFSIRENTEREDTITVYFDCTPDWKIKDIPFNISIDNGLLVVKKHGFDEDYMQTKKYYVIVQTGAIKGEANVTIEALNKKVTAKCEIFDKNDYPIESIKFLIDTSIETTYKAYDLSESVEVNPFGVTDYWPVEWSSDNESVATVKEGLVVFTRAGEVNITASARDKSAVCHFTSLWAIESLTWESGLQSNLTIGENTTWKYKLVANYNEYDQNRIQWTSSDDNIATVSNAGIITAIGAGTATISVVVTDDAGEEFKLTKEMTVTSAIDLESYHYQPGTHVWYGNRGRDNIDIDIYKKDTYEDYVVIKVTGSNLANDGIYTIDGNTLSATVEYADTEEKVTNVSGTIQISGNQLTVNLSLSKGGKTAVIEGGPLEVEE
ncbi:Ig-like domain-containing protein [Bacteroides sp.]